MIRWCNSRDPHQPHNWTLGRRKDQVHCPGRYDTLNGWTICPEREHGGLWVLRDPSGVKRGATQSRAGARIMRRRKIQGS